MPAANADTDAPAMHTGHGADIAAPVAAPAWQTETLAPAEVATSAMPGDMPDMPDVPVASPAAPAIAETSESATTATEAPSPQRPAQVSIPTAERPVVNDLSARAPASPAAPAAAPAQPAATPPVDIDGALQQAGLVMVQTTSSAPAQAPTTTPAPVLGRKPRPVPVIADEPLQIVETRSNPPDNTAHTG
jgi:hypothetical protein